MPNCTSTQKTTQIESTATNGANTTAFENLNVSEPIYSQNQTSRHNLKFIQIVRSTTKILSKVRTIDHQIYFIFTP